MASEYERQVADLGGPLLRPRYPIEVFYCSWLRCLSVRSVLFSRGTRSAKVCLTLLEALAQFIEDLEVEELQVVAGGSALIDVVILNLRSFVIR